ncbi:hypothetical protein Hypma_003735 [Hypsizygus marmoreus]|uniref:Endonuclease/exonuclease/phosphatase domain-containing protein n=1 Tax=Hypsizygus marmoreus TaxID=39966 RepID=A0A369J1G4_HYPMA|nr:hypothetical protein Hypma_003735 [Hypsizygus marmoreus]
MSQDLPISHRNDLSGPDFMVLQLGDTLIYNVYLLPETASWADSNLDTDPTEALAASLALAHSANFKMLMMGDFNARTASLVASSSHPAHASEDNAVPSTRGRWLLRVLAEHGLALVSGATRFGPKSGAFTSFQGTRRTVHQEKLLVPQDTLGHLETSCGSLGDLRDAKDKCSPENLQSTSAVLQLLPRLLRASQRHL